MILRAVVGALTVWINLYCYAQNCIQGVDLKCNQNNITNCGFWNVSNATNRSTDQGLCFKSKICSVKLCSTGNHISCFSFTLESSTIKNMTIALFNVDTQPKRVNISQTSESAQSSITYRINIQTEYNFVIGINFSGGNFTQIKQSEFNRNSNCSDSIQSMQILLNLSSTAVTTVPPSSNAGGIAAAVIVIVLFVVLVVVVVILYRRDKLKFLKNHSCVSFLGNNKSSKNKSDDCGHSSATKDTSTTTQADKGLSISSPTELQDSTRPLEGDYSIITDEDVRSTQAAGGSLLSPLKPNDYSSHQQSKLPGNNDPVYHKPNDVPVGGFYHTVQVNEDPSRQNDPGLYHILEAGSDYPNGHSSGQGRSIYQFASQPGELTSAPPPSAAATAKNSRDGDYDKLQVKGQTPGGQKRGEGEEGNTYSHLTDNDDPDAYNSVTREVKPTVIDGDYSHLND